MLITPPDVLCYIGLFYQHAPSSHYSIPFLHQNVVTLFKILTHCVLLVHNVRSRQKPILLHLSVSITNWP